MRLPPHRAVPLVGAVTTVMIWSLAWNALVHGWMLSSAEQALTGLARPLHERNLGLALAVTLGLAIGFVAWLSGAPGPLSRRDGAVRGVVFAVFVGLLVDANQYLLYPIPGQLALSWFGAGVVEFAAAGAIATRWLHPASSSAHLS
jgi:hypothetical protein